MSSSQLAQFLSDLAEDLENDCESQEEKGESYITLQIDDVRDIIKLLSEASSEIDGFIRIIERSK